MKVNLSICFMVLVFFLIQCKKEEITYEHNFTLSSPSGNAYEIKVEIEGGTGEENVFFVLDAKNMLPIIKEQLKNISTPKSIILVGIFYPEGNKRERDYTISNTTKGTGEGSQFLNFITEHLDSVLVSKNIYKPNAKKGIIGHSLGGLFGAFAFCKSNNFFENYLIMSPALFYDDYAFFGIEKETRTQNNSSLAKIYLGVGESEDLGMNNSFAAFKDIINTFYPNIRLKSEIVKGSHYYSRDENITNGLTHLLQ